MKRSRGEGGGRSVKVITVALARVKEGDEVVDTWLILRSFNVSTSSAVRCSENADQRSAPP